MHVIILNDVCDSNQMVLLCILDCDGTQLHALLPPQWLSSSVIPIRDLADYMIVQSRIGRYQ